MQQHRRTQTYKCVHVRIDNFSLLLNQFHLSFIHPPTFSSITPSKGFLHGFGLKLKIRGRRVDALSSSSSSSSPSSSPSDVIIIYSHDDVIITETCANVNRDEITCNAPSIAEKHQHLSPPPSATSSSLLSSLLSSSTSSLSPSSSSSSSPSSMLLLSSSPPSWIFARHHNHSHHPHHHHHHTHHQFAEDNFEQKHPSIHPHYPILFKVSFYSPTFIPSITETNITFSIYPSPLFNEINSDDVMMMTSSGDNDDDGDEEGQNGADDRNAVNAYDDIAENGDGGDGPDKKPPPDLHHRHRLRSNDLLILTGQDLNTVLTLDDYNIKVDQTACPLTYLSHDKLTCKLNKPLTKLSVVKVYVHNSSYTVLNAINKENDASRHHHQRDSSHDQHNHHRQHFIIKIVLSSFFIVAIIFVVVIFIFLVCVRSRRKLLNVKSCKRANNRLVVVDGGCGEESVDVCGGGVDGVAGGGSGGAAEEGASDEWKSVFESNRVETATTTTQLNNSNTTDNNNNSSNNNDNIHLRYYSDYCSRMFCHGSEDVQLHNNIINTHNPDTPTHQPRKSQLSSSCEYGLKLLNQLVNNRIFMTIFIRTCEECGRFSEKDKISLAALLTVAVFDNMEYYTDILKALLTERIKTSSAPTPPSPSIPSPTPSSSSSSANNSRNILDLLLSNWFAILMHSYVKQQASQVLHELFESLSQHIHRGPVDAITGQSKWSLCLHEVLKVKLEYKTITLKICNTKDAMKLNSQHDCNNINKNNSSFKNSNLNNDDDDDDDDNETYSSSTNQNNNTTADYTNYNTTTFNSSNNNKTSFHRNNYVKIKVLDCDTISQVKHKLIQVLYKNVPYSKRPDPENYDLVWRLNRSGTVKVLQDSDNSNKKDGTSYRLNTLEHYKVEDGAFISLVSRQQETDQTKHQQQQHQQQRKHLQGHNHYQQQQQQQQRHIDLIQSSRNDYYKLNLKPPSSATTTPMTMTNYCKHAHRTSNYFTYYPPPNHSGYDYRHGAEDDSYNYFSDNNNNNKNNNNHKNKNNNNDDDDMNSQSKSVVQYNGAHKRTYWNTYVAKNKSASPYSQSLHESSSSHAATPYLLTINCNRHCKQKYHHLVKPSTSSSSSSSRSNPPIHHINLSRFVSSKDPLNQPINNLFKCIFNITSISHLLPIKYLFEFIDSHLTPTNRDLIQAWKVHCYPLLFWCDVISHVDNILDLPSSTPIHPSLDTIAQLLIECCASSNSNVSNCSVLGGSSTAVGSSGSSGSSSNYGGSLFGLKNRDGRSRTHFKNVFNKEISKFQLPTKRFYEYVESMDGVCEAEMNLIFNQETKSFQGDFSRNDALLQLYSFMKCSHNELLRNLESDIPARTYGLPIRMNQLQVTMASEISC